MRGGPALAPAPDTEDGLSRGEEARSVARGRGRPMGRGERGHQPIREQGTEIAEGGQGFFSVCSECIAPCIAVGFALCIHCGALATACVSG